MKFRVSQVENAGEKQLQKTKKKNGEKNRHQTTYPASNIYTPKQVVQLLNKIDRRKSGIRGEGMNLSKFGRHV